MLWNCTEIDECKASALAQSICLSNVVTRILVEQGITQAEDAEEFLRPRLAQLDDPFAIKNLKSAAKRIEKAVENKESIVVFGDYDVDGVTSTTQMVSMLRTLELTPKFCVPRRLDEGYGLSLEAIERVFDGQIPQLFIALDCGTNAHESIAYLRDLGIDVIVVDHHQTKTQAPKDCIFINPHVNDHKDAPWRNLCTAGLVFKLLHGLLKLRRQADDPRVESIQLKDYLDLVAMGTVADLVPLQGENRILSWFGLKHLRANDRAGVRALAEVAGIDSCQEMVSSDISFKIAPRINASGRLADASLPIELLLQDDYRSCINIAERLDEINKERQAIERGITKVAEERAASEFADAPGIILFSEDWHPGVVGIVASRVSRRFHKPCVILGAEGELAKGSGRSVASVNLVEVFQRCTHLLEHWGGHPMAAGVSLKSLDVAAFTKCYLESLEALYPGGLPEPSIEISTWLEMADLNESLLEELDRLHPFGQGNREPIFGLRDLVLEDSPDSFGDGNFRFRLPAQAGAKRGISGIAWQLGEPPKIGKAVDMAFRFSWNYWRNNRYPQLTLID
jgi:single-stranded-DNA-specific exonuclease